MSWELHQPPKLRPKMPKPQALTMSLSISGRAKACLVRITMRHPPRWMELGNTVDLKRGTGKDLGFLRIVPGTQRNIIASPSYGSDVIQLVFGVWAGIPRAKHFQEFCQFRVTNGVLTVTLPGWAIPEAERPMLAIAAE